MLLGWVIVYVDDPPAAREFYMQAFGLQGGFAVPGEPGDYAELDTGPTKLAFAAYALGESSTSPAACTARMSSPPARRRTWRSRSSPRTSMAPTTWALEAGCASLAEPADKPQGQRVAYVRDPFGTLVELATPLKRPRRKGGLTPRRSP